MSPPRKTAQGPLPRRRPRRALWLLLGVGKVLLGIAPVIGVGVWLATAPVFDLELEVDMGESEWVTENWVRNQLAPVVGQNLPLLSLERTGSRLDHEWVREARLVKRLPSTLMVHILEHRPAAVFEAGDRSWVIDRDGRAITDCERASEVCRQAEGTRARDAGLVRLAIQNVLAAGGPGESASSTLEAAELEAQYGSGEVLARTLKRAVDVAAEVKRFDWGREVFSVGVLSEDDYLLASSGRPGAVLVRGSDLHAKGSVFELLRAAIREHNDPEVVDLRFRDRIVLSTRALAVERRPAESGAVGTPRSRGGG